MKVNRMRIITVKRCIQQEDNWPLLAGRNMFNTSELLFYISKKNLKMSDKRRNVSVKISKRQKHRDRIRQRGVGGFA